MNREIEKNEKKKLSLASVRNVFKTIIWPRRKLVSLGFLLIFINRLTGLVLPWSTKYLIDDVIVQKNMQLFKLLLAAIGAATILQAVTTFLLTRLLSVEAQHLIAQLRARLQKQIIRLPLRFFDENKSGALVSRIMSDVEGVRNLVGTGLVQLFGGILTTVVTLVIMININARLTLFGIVPLLIFGFIMLKAFSYIRPIFRKRGAIRADVTGRLTESLGGIRVIKGFSAEKREEKEFEKGVDRIFQNVKTTLTTTSLVVSAGTFLIGAASILIMSLGGNMIINEQMTVGDFFSFTMFLAFLIAPIIQMSNIGTQFTEAFAGLDRMEEILNEKRETEDERRTRALTEVKGNITFESVSFSYEEGKEVLKDITFEAPAGTVNALVGSSGSGKTTIASLAASFFTANKGTISVDGIDLSSVMLESYRSHLGVVLQDDFLFEGTISENIMFGSPDATETQLDEAVRAAYVSEFTEQFDDGLDTHIGERGVKLSGGQRQRVTIARALLADPKILILDEATSNLDTESEKYIQKSLTHLMKGRTTFVIAHRLSTIRQADQILVIEKGRIVERGTHDALYGEKGRYYQLYTYQARI
ncbi:ABC transporter ATP-binding protein [candidate division KSB1 bacterium]